MPDKFRLRIDCHDIDDRLQRAYQARKTQEQRVESLLKTEGSSSVRVEAAMRKLGTLQKEVQHERARCEALEDRCILVGMRCRPETSHLHKPEHKLPPGITAKREAVYLRDMGITESEASQMRGVPKERW